MVTKKKVAKKKITTKTTKKKSVKNTKKKSVNKTTKKVSKPTTKTTTKTVKKDYSSIIFGVVGIIILAIIIGAAIYFMPKSDVVETSVVAASVNGVEITADQLNKQYMLLPEQYRQTLTKEIVLEQLIDEELLLAYGRENGIEVTPEEIQNEVHSIMDNGGLKLEDLEANLNEFNLTTEDFETLVGRKLLIERSMALIMEDLPEIPGSVVQDYYDKHIDSYKIPEQVKVRHILIRSTVENAAVFAKDLMDQVKNGADFCKLVKENSDDPGSKETCGEYTFPRGMMVPEFEEASFKMKPGEITLVNTQFGYHVIEKLEDIPESVKSLESVQDEILTQLAKDMQVKAYQEFITKAKADAEIIYYEE